MKCGRGDHRTGKHRSFCPSCFASESIEAPARLFASEPWLLKLAPVVLITLSLGTFEPTDAGKCRYTVKEKNHYMQTSVGFNDV